MSSHIKKLIAQGEGETLDFKQNIPEASKFAKTLVSFANTKGGTILVGVRDNSSIAGVRSEEEKFMLELSAFRYCRPSIPLQIKEWVIDGKLILEAIIPESTFKPCLAINENGKWLAYVRKNDETLIAGPVVYGLMVRKSKNAGLFIKYGEAEKLVFESLISNGIQNISELIANTKLKKGLLTRVLITLSEVGHIEPVSSSK